MDLSWLITPVEKHTFVHEHWSKLPLRISRQEPEYYANLLSEADLEFALQSAARAPGALEILVEGDRGVSPHSHSHALEAFRSGRSLRVNSIQRFSQPIMVLIRSMELAIGSTVNVNLYLTPGAGLMALSRHYDTHDVFILQLFGNKIWRLFDPPTIAPLEHLPLQARESMREMKAFRLRDDQSGKETCTLTEEFTLSTGDMLYLPRGFWHEAESEPDAISCHLTVGVQPNTYLDLLTVALARAANSNPLLRASLPYGFTIDKQAEHVVEQQIKQIVQELPGQLDARAALGDMAGLFLRQHKAGLENNIFRPLGIDATENLQSDTSLRVGKGVVFGINSSTEPPQFLMGAKAFAITTPYEEACRYIATAGSFTPADLPGELTLEEKLTFSSQLMSEDVLVPVMPFSLPAREEPKWVPTHIDLKTRTLKWVDLGAHPLNEPFLHQTIKRFQETTPKARTRMTRLRALTKIEEQLRPSGFIFHISRCGSTLLSNSLRYFENTTVVSEPQPVGSVLELLSRSAVGDDKGVPAEALLQGVVNAYGHRRTGTETGFVLKFSSWNLLQLDMIRKLWPAVPIVILVRDPLEVAVSCIDDPPGWMRQKDRHRMTLGNTLGWDAGELKGMLEATFCARMIGEFLEQAERARESGCTILDYRDLNATAVEDVARWFNIAVSSEASQEVARNFSRYSKDPEQKREHQEDSALKRNKATAELRQQVERWAQPQYDAIAAMKTA
jgi:ribosomal protein L16 Arg81 hydroxylase